MNLVKLKEVYMQGIVGRERKCPPTKPALLLRDWCYFEFSYDENKEKMNFKLQTVCTF